MDDADSLERDYTIGACRYLQSSGSDVGVDFKLEAKCRIVRRDLRPQEAFSGADRDGRIGVRSEQFVARGAPHGVARPWVRGGANVGVDLRHAPAPGEQ